MPAAVQQNSLLPQENSSLFSPALKSVIEDRFSPCNVRFLPPTSIFSKLRYRWMQSYLRVCTNDLDEEDWFKNALAAHPHSSSLGDLREAETNLGTTEIQFKVPLPTQTHNEDGTRILFLNRDSQSGACLLKGNDVDKVSATNSLRNLVKFYNDINQMPVSPVSELGRFHCVVGFEFNKFAAVFGKWILGFENNPRSYEAYDRVFNSSPGQMDVPSFLVNLERNSKSIPIFSCSENAGDFLAWLIQDKRARPAISMEAEYEIPKKRDIFGIKPNCGKSLSDFEQEIISR